MYPATMRNLRSFKHEINMKIGDFNANIGRKKREGVTGGFGVGETNERGEMLIQLSTEEELVIKKTFFDLPNTQTVYLKIATGPLQSYRNISDFFLINKDFQIT